jgi:outer membrane protein
MNLYLRNTICEIRYTKYEIRYTLYLFSYICALKFLSMKVTRLLIFFILCSFDVNAQQQFTLPQCIETALKNNITLKKGELVMQSSGIDVKTSRAAMLPNLNASFSQNYNYGRNIDPVTNAYISNSTQSTNMGLNSTIILFNGFQLLNNLRLAKINYSASGTDVLAAQNDLALQVAAAFLQVMYAEDNLTNMQAQLDLTISQRDRMKIMVDAGKMAMNSLTDLDAQQANDEYNIVVANNGIVSAKLTLIQLMEMPATTNYAIERPNIALPLNEQYDVNVVYEQSLNNRPEVKGAMLRQEAAAITEKIALGGLSPRLSFSAGLNTLYSNKYVAYNGSSLIGFYPIGITKTTFDTVYAPEYKNNFKSVNFSDQLNQNFGRYVSLGLTIPLFNNLKVYGNVQKSRINTVNQDLSLAQTKNTLLKNIQQAITDEGAAKAKYKAAEKSLTAQNTSFTNTELRYNQGLSSYLDYVTAKNNKAKAEVNLQQAKYDLILKSKIIDFYRGINITL